MTVLTSTVMAVCISFFVKFSSKMCYNFINKVRDAGSGKRKVLFRIRCPQEVEGRKCPSMEEGSAQMEE